MKPPPPRTVLTIGWDGYLIGAGQYPMEVDRKSDGREPEADTMLFLEKRTSERGVLVHDGGSKVGRVGRRDGLKGMRARTR